MKLDLISECWDVLREHIDMNDRSDAADSLVNWLIDNNFESDEIKDAFRDKDVVKALKGYMEEHEDEFYEDEEEESDEDWD
jgi:hypothetical protein